MADSSIIFILQKEILTLDILSSEKKKNKIYKEECMFHKMEIKIQSVVGFTFDQIIWVFTLLKLFWV